MFRKRWWLFGKTISDEGFALTFTSRTTLSYQIGRKTMAVDVEVGWLYIDVFHSSMRHWDDDSSMIDGKTGERNVGAVSTGRRNTVQVGVVAEI